MFLKESHDRIADMFHFSGVGIGTEIENGNENQVSMVLAPADSREPPHRRSCGSEP